MKIASFLLLSCVYIFAADFWTLSGLTKVNVYVSNTVSLIKPETMALIKQNMKNTLVNQGIKTDQRDCPILMLTLSEIENDETHYVYVTLSLGEDVHTLRDKKSVSFALTYMINDFIEPDESELDSEILVSVTALLFRFKEQFEDDKE